MTKRTSGPPPGKQPKIQPEIPASLRDAFRQWTAANPEVAADPLAIFAAGYRTACADILFGKTTFEDVLGDSPTP
jgi:hypothetical protein